VAEENRTKKTILAKGMRARTGQAAVTAAVQRPAEKIDMGVLPGLMGYMLRQSQLLVYQDFHQAVAAENIRPPQFSIMELVGRNPGLRPSDVSTSLAISRANLVPLLADLEARGWISRGDDKHDGRAHSLHLSRAGAAKLARLHELILPHEDRLAARLGPTGRDELLKLLTALITTGDA
jgi:DNA-binding MarR family transcriptional regulator